MSATRKLAQTTLEKRLGALIAEARYSSSRGESLPRLKPANMYSARITADNPELVTKCFAQEEKNILGRATYSITKKGGKAVFDIKAKDSTALRTALNSITKILTVIEKTKGIK